MCLSPGALQAQPGEADSRPAGLDQDRLLAVRRDTEWLSRRPTRLPGTSGHRQARQWLAGALASLPADRLRLWTSEFAVVVPQVRSSAGLDQASLTLASGPLAGRHRVHPLWPSGVRLNTTPSEGIAGRLVYIGAGEPAQVPPRSLRGQIAVMEMSGGEHWREAFAAGAAAVVLLGSEQVSFRQASGHLFPMPVYLPRFYVPDGPLAQALRADGREPATLHCAADWVETTATNFYALVLPAGGGGRPTGRRALAVAARYDAMSIAPDLAPDADAAVDAAVALALLRDLAAHPPDKPVLVALVDAVGAHQMGMRQMLADVAVPLQAAQELLREDRRRAEEEYVRPAELAEELAGDQRAIDKLSLGRYEPLRRYVKDEVDRDIISVDGALHPLRLQTFRDQPAEQRQALRERIRQLEGQRQALYVTLRLMTEPRPRQGGAEPPIPEEYRPLAGELWQRAGRRVTGQLREARARLEAWDRRERLQQELRQALGLGRAGDRTVSFVLGIDLSDAGLAAGPLGYCDHLRQKETGNHDELLRWLRKAWQQGGEDLWPESLKPAVDAAPLLGFDDAQSDSVGPLASLSSAAQSFGVPAATWATLNAERVRTDTPIDTADRLDWSRLGPQVQATLRLLRRLADDPSFHPSYGPGAKWTRIEGEVVDRAVGEPLPRVPMHGYLAVLVNRQTNASPGQISAPPFCPGVRRQQFARTGIDGRFVFDLWPGFTGYGGGYEDRHYLEFLLQAYDLAEDGSITRAVDMGRAGRRTKLDVRVQSPDRAPLRAAVFSCREQTAVGLVDPRFLLTLSGSVLKAQEATPPQRHNLVFQRGCLSALLEPGIRWELVLRAGITRNRLVLVNMADPEQVARERLSEQQAMRGFAVGEPLPEHPYHLSARDLLRLNQGRLAQYHAAGIRSRPLQERQDRSREQLQQVDEAVQADRGAAFSSAVSGAVANAARAYQAVRDTGNDVVRGAVFLLLLLVPFAFAMERLLVASTIIYRQIAGAMVIFAAMVAVLWSFHPAFRISSQPLMIIMAFAIISMSALVLAVVYRKFETGLEEVRSGRAEASGAATSRWGVLGTAVRLGIANMRKRKIRTALTGLSVVLVTFALLCFVSTSRYAGQQEFDVKDRASFAGVLLRQPSNRAVPRAALSLLKAMGAEPVPRWWWCRYDSALWRLRVRHEATGRQVSLKAALGLAPGERNLGPLGRAGEALLPRWERFAAQEGCYLAASTAERLGAKVGDRIALAGRSLELLGTFRAEDFEAAARDLDGRTLLPTDFAAMPDEQRTWINRQDIGQMEEEFGAAAGLEIDEDLPAVAPEEMAVVPAWLLDGLEYASLRSVAVRTPDEPAARALAHAVAERLSYPVYFSSEGRVRVLTAAPLLPQAPRGLLIPLGLGGLIIFTTMLSAIAERRREIYVYTSLGLAPLHVGALFLAEAVTYGMMGSVFGYVAGQGLGTLLSQLGWMGGITLNYSGTHAVIVMVLVLALVVLSSLVPAYLGGRLAAPSNRRSWSLPPPEGDGLELALPFTATPATAPGVMAFLLEYLDAHREGSIGRFATDELRWAAVPAGARRDLELRATVWLAPFDLGVRQTARIYLQPTPGPRSAPGGQPGPAAEESLEIRTELRRQSGQPATWWNLNHVFVGDLRRQLLGWRKVRARRVIEYIESGRSLLADARSGGTEARDA